MTVLMQMATGLPSIKLRLPSAHITIRIRELAPVLSAKQLEVLVAQIMDQMTHEFEHDGLTWAAMTAHTKRFKE